MKIQALIVSALAAIASAQASIFSGQGFGTYYYDTQQVQACGNDFSNINQGNVECSFSEALSLNAMKTNYVVAMNHTQLKGNLDTYCGRRVRVTVNGKMSDLPLFIGDGCERCGNGVPNGGWNSVGAPGLDFSYSVLSELSAEACAAGHIDLSWEIVDEILYHFNTH